MHRHILAILLSLAAGLPAHAAEEASEIMAPAEADAEVEVFEYMTAPVPPEPEFIGTGPFIWFEPSWGPGSLGITESFKLKYGRQNKLYGLEFATTEDNCDPAIDCPMNKDTLESFSQEYREINLLFGYRWYGRFYHFSGDVGVGYLSGELGEECTPSSFRSIDLCKKTRIDTVSVPVNITLLFGKYFGTGVNFHATLNPDAQFYSISWIFAFGNFN